MGRKKLCNSDMDHTLPCSEEQVLFSGRCVGSHGGRFKLGLAETRMKRVEEVVTHKLFSSTHIASFFRPPFLAL